jgi:hypothetical protein
MGVDAAAADAERLLSFFLLFLNTCFKRPRSSSSSCDAAENVDESMRKEKEQKNQFVTKQKI